MKTCFCALFILTVLIGCRNGKTEKIYLPRNLTVGEDFNTYTKDNNIPFTVLKAIATEKPAKSADQESVNVYSIKFRDTTIRIQPNEADKDMVVDKFAVAQFVNTQKTCLLVQLSDNTGLIAPFYLLTLKNNQLEVVKLYRASTGKQDKEVTKGMFSLGNSGYLINNDYFITNVNAKVYTIKRQKPDERIQGEFFLKSADKQTLVFLLTDSFYEVHYPSGETFTLPFPAALPNNKSALYSWIQTNFSWQKNNKGISFLMENKDNDRIVDIKEFK